MAFVALEQKAGEMLGMVHLHVDANYEVGEFAILVRSDLKGRGLGWKLMKLMLDYGREEKLRRVTGQVLRENRTMLSMCSELGFTIEDIEGVPEAVAVTLVFTASNKTVNF